MCNPALAIMGASAIVGASAARNSAKAQQQSLLGDAMVSDRSAVTADNNALVADNNAEIANWQARDAIHMGESQVTTEQRQRQTALDQSDTQTATTKSRQKVALAGNGVDITQGSAVDVLTSTDYVGALNKQNINDAAARNTTVIRDNAIKNAWGYSTQAISYQNTASNDRADAALYRYDAQRQRAGVSGISANKAAAVSLLGSAGQVASSWYAQGKGG